MDKRLLQHNAGHSKSTKHGVPWVLAHVEVLSTRAEAVRKERHYKTGHGREQLGQLLADSA